ncbi:WecB/TagA/CpsF family glycosyltransferase [Lactobacillus sp. UCMA15818]|uniref:WecB/TagA/CpsF family glycosyltransferase n=1 Tax=Lactobacillus sp. UCMA15818 TaxID=2583394 RepID=UPI0025B14C5E|nr:WecB/TagA/CpsF family glycosyltransferase [Lactobacillus sp. UCMA15818]MDN2452668.1 WecB/TagA/CpsF family glycosyltransferase [Lactobacillus sp. UCMA15818]
MLDKYKKIAILGIDFTKITNSELLEQLKKDSLSHSNRFIITANPEIVLYARDNPEYLTIITSADYTIADGIGIIKGANILNTPLPERVTGFDTLCSLLEFANEKQKSVYFLGAKPEIIKKTITKVRYDYPALKIAGYHDGYFKNKQKIATEIAASKPDFVFVALGFPKQEFFIAKYRQLTPSIWMGVGGSFDVLAGTVKRAPLFWQKHHIEWLYRLFQEPARFWRMLALPKYLIMIYLKKFGFLKN